LINTYVISPAAPVTLTSSATANIDIRLNSLDDIKFFLNQTWPSGCGSTTGIAVNLYPGWGAADPAEIKLPIPYVLSNPASANVSTVPQFSTNYAPVLNQSGGSAIANPPANSSAGTSTTTAFYLNAVNMIWTSWMRMQIVNLDSAHPVKIYLNADLY
jgi:hypothetical protein